MDHPAPSPVDLDLYSGAEANTEPVYCHPRRVSFCSRCVISNQRPSSTVEFKHKQNSKKQTISFDADGVCDACRVAEIKTHNIDWEERRRELETVLDRFRSRNGSYDCILPGSGGKDSFYASHVLKYEYGKTP